jgi:hypothetical protein
LASCTASCNCHAKLNNGLTMVKLLSWTAQLLHRPMHAHTHARTQAAVHKLRRIPPPAQQANPGQLLPHLKRLTARPVQWDMHAVVQLTTCVSVILLMRLPGVGAILTMGSGPMSGDRPLGSIMDRVRLDVPGVPKGDDTPPTAPKLVLTAAGAAGLGGAGVAAAAAVGAAAAGVLVVPLVLAAGGSATAAEAAGRADVDGSSAGSPNSVSNLSRMSTWLPSICSLSLSTKRLTCTAPSLKGSERPADVCMGIPASH